MRNYLPDEAAAPDATRVLRFWFGEPPEYGSRRKRWFDKDPALDEEVRTLFSTLLAELAAGSHMEWLERRADCLAYILAADQFPRHIFRGDRRAFSTDPLALAAARSALARGLDRDLRPVERLFLYLPFQHSEALEDQLMACELCAPLASFPETADVPRYAMAHRDIVKRFERFPHRNSALGRPSTPEELEFLKEPGSSF
jgi:uncharacterized protein (DUF924 family)